MTRPILDVSNLTIRRGNTLILDRVNWRVERGEHWAVLGANGSGKTSLLSALTGYLTPTDGAIRVLGRTFGAADWRELRLRIGLVSSSIRQMMPPDEPALETIITGKYAMIDLWGRATAADRARAGRILGQIECEQIADRPWLYLSQGERQRVLIGRALMARPKLLILDEACAGLDPSAREHFLQFLQRLGRQKSAPTIIFVTHHVEEVMPFLSHVLILRQGRILAAGARTATLTSSTLSRAFAARILLERRGDRHFLRVGRRSGRVV